MQYEYVKNPVWDNEEHTSLTVTVKFTDFEEEVEFTAVPDDVEEHSRKIYAEAVSGKFGTIQEFTLTAEEQQQALMEQKKALRAEAVSKITVTVDGMEFDGDETAQDRMARAITMFQANNLPADYQTDWVLADNTIAKVTVTQLSQALLLAGQAQTALWTVPYQVEETNAAE